MSCVAAAAAAAIGRRDNSDIELSIETRTDTTVRDTTQTDNSSAMAQLKMLFARPSGPSVRPTDPASRARRPVTVAKSVLPANRIGAVSDVIFCVEKTLTNAKNIGSDVGFDTDACVVVVLPEYDGHTQTTRCADVWARNHLGDRRLGDTPFEVD